MMYPFTVKDVFDEVIRIGKANPKFVYTDQPDHDVNKTCGYAGANWNSIAGQPCIVGQALQNLGVPANELFGLDDSASAVVRDFASDGADSMDTRLDLVLIQRLQDRGFPWGVAVTEYKNPNL